MKPKWPPSAYSGQWAIPHDKLLTHCKMTKLDLMTLRQHHLFGKNDSGPRLLNLYFLNFHVNIQLNFLTNGS